MTLPSRMMNTMSLELDDILLQHVVTDLHPDEIDFFSASSFWQAGQKYFQV